MKKSNLKRSAEKQKAESETDDLGGAKYFVVCKIGLPFDIDKGEDAKQSVQTVTEFVTAALQAAAADGVQCTLTHSTLIETTPTNIPIIPIQVT